MIMECLSSRISLLLSGIESTPAISSFHKQQLQHHQQQHHQLSSRGIQSLSLCLSSVFLRKTRVSAAFTVADQVVDDDGDSSAFGNDGAISGIGVKEPVYEVLEVDPKGNAITKEVSRRQLLRSSGLRLRDIRSVDPSLWVTNSMPSLLVRDHAILLNLGSLRAIATPECVLVFDHKSIGGQLFLESLQQRLGVERYGTISMPFELEVVEAALLARTQRLEQTLMIIHPRVLALLEVLPNKLNADVLEDLRVSKQSLVELIAKSDALRQMLLDLLESPDYIRRMAILGRDCKLGINGSYECLVSSDKQIAEEEENEIEMLIENYLMRSESCHGQAQKLLDSAKEMEDSISINLSSRRLEVGRLELLLQVATFCSALGALVAGIFGMNLRSYLEERAYAFWLATGGIIMGAIILFSIMFGYLKQRRIL